MKTVVAGLRGPKIKAQGQTGRCMGYLGTDCTWKFVKGWAGAVIVETTFFLRLIFLSLLKKFHSQTGTQAQ